MTRYERNQEAEYYVQAINEGLLLKPAAYAGAIGAIALVFASPVAPASWIYEAEELEEIRADDPSLIAWEES